MEETDDRINKIRDEYENEIKKIQNELLELKKKELIELEQQIQNKKQLKSQLSTVSESKDNNEDTINNENKDMNELNNTELNEIFENEKSKIIEKYQMEELELMETKKKEMENLIRKQLEDEHRLAVELSQQAKEGNDDAQAKLNRLRKQHEDEVKKLNDEMLHEKKLQENSLKQRLEEKKRKLISKLSNEYNENDINLDELLSTNKINEIDEEKQKLLLEMEEKHAREMNEAILEARQREMDAAVATARELALETEKQLKLRLEQEANQRALERLHASLLDDEKKREAMISEKVRGGKDKLEVRLAEKKARKERELQEQEEKALEELARKQAIEKEEKEKLRQAKMIWSERIQQALNEADEMNLLDRAKEDYCFRETLGKNLVPETHLSEAAQLIMRSRHLQEMQDLLKLHFDQRVTALKTAVEKVMHEKAEARIELVEKLVARESTDEFIKLSLGDLDTRYSRKQAEAEEGAIMLLEREHTKQQMTLRQKQLEEISAAINMYSDSSQLAKLSELNEQSQLEIMAEYRNRLAADKATREERIQKEREESEARLRQMHEENLLKMKQQLEEQEMKEQREIENKRLLLLKQKEEFEKKQQHETDNLHKQEKQRILDNFEKEITAVNEALVHERNRRKSKLEHRLAAQRKNKNDAAATASKTTSSQKPDSKTLSTKAPSSKVLPIVTEETVDNVDNDNISISASVGNRRKSGGDIAPLVNSIQVIEGKLEHIGKVMSSLEHIIPMQVSALPTQTTNPVYEAKLISHDQKLDKIVSLLETNAFSNLKPSNEIVTQSPQISSYDDKFERMDRLMSTLEATGLLQSKVDELSNQIKKTDQEIKLREEEAEMKLKNKPIGYIDSNNPPQGEELIISDENKLSIQETARLEFGRQLTHMIGVPQVQLRPAKSLPPLTGYQNNAFKNSYFYDEKSQVLYVHTTRLLSSGDFGLVAIHALSHIKVNPSDLSNDSDPLFVSEFYSNLKILSQDLYKKSSHPIAATALTNTSSSSNNPSIVNTNINPSSSLVNAPNVTGTNSNPASTPSERRITPLQRTGSFSKGTNSTSTSNNNNNNNTSGTGTNTNDYFSPVNLTERIKQYAKISNIPSEFIDRYLKEDSTASNLAASNNNNNSNNNNENVEGKEQEM